jgi:hypothetical protein
MNPHSAIKVLMCSLVLFAVLSQQVAAQESGDNRVFATLGFNQSFADLKALNGVIRAYNEDNPWQSGQLKEIHRPGGICGSVGADFQRLLLQIGYTMRIQVVSGNGPLNQFADPYEQRVRYNASTVDLGLGYFFVRKQRLKLGIGGSLDLGSLKISGKRGQYPDTRGIIYQQYSKELYIATSGYLHAMFALRPGLSPGIFLQPYYQLSLYQNDYGGLNRGLRPMKYLGDPINILGNGSNFGFKVGLFFGS